MSAEAEAIVAKVTELEQASMEARIRLEGVSRAGVIGWGFGLELSDAGKRVLAGNQMLPVGVRNAPEWKSANESDRDMPHYSNKFRRPRAPPEITTTGLVLYARPRSGDG
jgi:hypothetical protein